MATAANPGLGQPVAPDGAGQAIGKALASLLDLEPRPVSAWGTAAVPPQATVTGTTRLVFVLDGRNRMVIPQGTGVIERVFTPGDCIVVSRRGWNHPLHTCTHEFITVDIGADKLRFLRHRWQAPGPSPGEFAVLYVYRIPCEATMRLADVCEALLPDPGRTKALGFVLRALLLQCQEELSCPSRAMDATWLRLSGWLEERLHRSVGRGEAARAIGVHPNHVPRIFRTMDTTMAQWLTSRRVRMAKDLLLASEMSVADIAHRCGFGSPSYFCGVFARTAGVSPARWRAEQRGAGSPADAASTARE